MNVRTCIILYYFVYSEQLQSEGTHISALQLKQIANDINRTDRSHQFYKGDDNVNLDRLQ